MNLIVGAYRAAIASVSQAVDFVMAIQPMAMYGEGTGVSWVRLSITQRAHFRAFLSVLPSHCHKDISWSGVKQPRPTMKWLLMRVGCPRKRQSFLLFMA
jgi:hypothetical protein